MILNNKLFKLSSLCAIGTIAIIVNQVFSSSADGILSTTSSTNIGTNSPKTKTESQLDKKTSTKSPGEVVVDNNGDILIDDEKVPTSSDATQVKKTEYLKGPVEGVNYNDYINYEEYKNVGISNINQYLNIRQTASKEGKVVGKLPPYGGCDILSTEKDKDGNQWYKIKSDKLEGYIISGELDANKQKQTYVVAGDEAQDKIFSAGRLIIKVDCDTLNVRTKPSTSSEILYQVSQGEELDVVGIEGDWIEVSVDVGDEKAYVAKEFVKVTFALRKAIEIEEILYGVSAERMAILNYAKQFLGNRYVYGKTSLTNGTDCSGYTMRIYEKFGITLPRTSRDQATRGTIITEDQLKPGDLVFYARGSSVSSVYHVAMYAGNGKIVHAANSRKGIIISNMKYTKPFRYVKVLND